MFWNESGNAFAKPLKVLVDLLMICRPVWIPFLVLPLSALARLVERLTGRLDEPVSAATHRARVARLAADVRAARAAHGGRAVKLATARHPGASISTRVHGRFKRSCDALIDVSGLDRVVALDPAQRCVCRRVPTRLCRSFSGFRISVFLFLSQFAFVFFFSLGRNIAADRARAAAR